MKDIVTKFDGSSTYSADEFNPNMAELENAVTGSGQSLNAVNLTQLGEAMGRYASGGGFFYNDGGSSNAFVLTSPLTFVQPKAYFNGMMVMCVAASSVTAAATINVNTIGSVALKDPKGLAIGKDYIRVGDTFAAIYNVANLEFRILLVSRVVPFASIMIFSGAVADIPAGWQLCDGTNGTPDLRNNFVRGAGDVFAPGAVGGSEITGSTVLSIAQMPAHTHTEQVNPNAPRSGGGTTGASGVIQTQNTGSQGGGLGHTHPSTVPPFFALAYIMKL